MAHVEQEDKRWGHGWPIHVLRRGQEIDRAAVELRPLIEIDPLSHLVCLRIVVTLGLVVQAAEIADPSRPIVDELNEGVHVGSALATPHDRFLVEVRCGDFLTGGKFAERFDQKSQWNSKLLL